MDHTREENWRIDYPPRRISDEVFDRVSGWALDYALEDSASGVTASPVPELEKALLTIADLHPDHHDPQQYKGATRRSLAEMARLVGIGADRLPDLYAICENLGLSQRHAHHIIASLSERRGR